MKVFAYVYGMCARVSNEYNIIANDIYRDSNLFDFPRLSRPSVPCLRFSYSQGAKERLRPFFKAP